MLDRPTCQQATKRPVRFCREASSLPARPRPGARSARRGGHGCQENPYVQGLIPSWAKDAKIGYRLSNARADTVASKPSFRSAFKRRRCLVPADGFYEWKRDGKVK